MVGGYTPRALGNIVRPRRLSGVLARPLNFTVRWQRGLSRTLHLWDACPGRHRSELAQHHRRMWNRPTRARLRTKLRGNGASRRGDGVLGDAT